MLSGHRILNPCTVAKSYTVHLENIPVTNLYGLRELSKILMKSQNLGLPFMSGEDKTVVYSLTLKNKTKQTSKKRQGSGSKDTHPHSGYRSSISKPTWWGGGMALPSCLDVHTHETHRQTLVSHSHL